MNRRTIAALAAAAMLAACSHKSSTTSTPAPTQDRGPSGRGGPGGPGGAGSRGPGARDAMLFRGITLSSDQQARVDSIRAAYRTQMDQLRQGGDRDAMRAQMRPMMERQQADIRAVLTADQQTVYDQNVAEMRSRMEQGGRPGGPPR